MCGQLNVGGCANPDLGHNGPCTPEVGEIGSKAFRRLDAASRARLLAQRDNPTGNEMVWFPK